MIKFDINGANIVFDEKMDNYNSIRKDFKFNAISIGDEFEKYCESSYKNTKQLFDNSYLVASNYIDNTLKKAIETLVSFDVITIDIELFKSTYSDKYLNFERLFNNLNKQYNNSSYSKNKKNNYKFHDIKPIIDTLKLNLYNDCFSIHYAIIDALIDNNIDNISNYVSEDEISKANALFNNYKDGFINKPNEEKVIKQIIALNPYREEFYKFMIKEDGDFSFDIENLTSYLGYDISGYKCELMEEYVENLLNNTYDVEDTKEKIIKYSKYIGFKNHSIYLTRVEAICMFENA